MKLRLLAAIARLLDIQFHVKGLPYGADYHRRDSSLSQSAQGTLYECQS